MPSPLARYTLAATLLLATAGSAAEIAKPQKSARDQDIEKINRIDARLKALDGLLLHHEWTAAETEARALVAAALERREGSFAALGPLAVAEAAEGRMEEALWDWTLAQNIQEDWDLKPFGPAGALLAAHPRRKFDEGPPELRRAGDGGPAFTPPKLLAAKKAEIATVWGAIPRGIRLQVIVDAQGHAVQPVVVESTSSALAYVLLQSVKESKFEPARVGEVPVMAFFELTIPTALKPLAQLVDFTGGPLAEIEAELRAGHSQAAERQSAKVWSKTLSASVPTASFLGVALALKALAQAGQGKEDSAICRWQAAQTLEPRLYGSDLSAYGAAGKLLQENPWGKRLPVPAEKKKPAEPGPVERPKILERPVPAFPEYARKLNVEDRVMLEATLTRKGVLRNPALFARDTLPGMAASALDATCDWRFQPATFHGEPVAVLYLLTVNFEIRH